MNLPLPHRVDRLRQGGQPIAARTRVDRRDTALDTINPVLATFDITMFHPMSSVGLGRRWHGLASHLHGFALVAPFPCGFVQAGHPVRKGHRAPWAAPDGRHGGPGASVPPALP